MKIALNGATTMHADLETDIKAASQAGYELIEVWAAKLRVFLESKTPQDLKQLLDEAGLKPHSINSIEHITFRSDSDYAEIKAECEELSRVAAQIDCPYVVVVPGKLPENSTKDSIIEESVRVLNELADISAEHGVSLAFEFLGQTDCSVQTLGLSNEIVKQCDRKEIGLVLDTFHFYAGRSEFSEIDDVDPEKMFIFHINDAENLPREELTDAHRLYPGTGILPLTEIKAGLDRIGYEEMVSIEIFRPEYWNHDPFEVARLSRESTISALGLEKGASA